MFLTSPKPTVYAVATMMDSYGHATCTTITPLPHESEAAYQLQLIQRPEGVVRVEYFTRYPDVIRHLKGERVKSHRIARAMIGLIEAVSGIA